MGSDDLFKKKSKKNKKKLKKVKRELKDSILIVCEGEKTEPNYFKSFPKSGIEIKIIGEGKNAKSLVESAIFHWKKLSKNDKYFENLYVVMDKDDFPLKNYNSSFQLIENFAKKVNSQRKYKNRLTSKFEATIIYANEAFELWYLLHYDYINTAVSRKQYQDFLSKKMKTKYLKNHENIYNILKEIKDSNKGLEFAINNAKKLRKKNKPDINPSTNVDILVIELINRYNNSKGIKDIGKIKYP